jgi:membrane protease YdiL (CAAX protease family)
MDSASTYPDPQRVSWRERIAAPLRGWGLAGTGALCVIAAGVWIATPVAAALILIWAWLSHTPFKDIGLAKPQSWAYGLAIGIALGIAEKLLMKAVVLPLLGAPAVNQAYHFLAENPKRAVVFALLAIFQAGICEEIVFRGYLFERLGRLWGNTVVSTCAIIITTSIIFGAMHFSSQGLAGAENAAITGLISAIVYLLSGRRLYVAMVSHAVFDLASLVLIYWNLEATVAHLIFN